MICRVRSEPAECDLCISVVATCVWHGFSAMFQLLSPTFPPSFHPLHLRTYFPPEIIIHNQDISRHQSQLEKVASKRRAGAAMACTPDISWRSVLWPAGFPAKQVRSFAAPHGLGSGDEPCGGEPCAFGGQTFTPRPGAAQLRWEIGNKMEQVRWYRLIQTMHTIDCRDM